MKNNLEDEIKFQNDYERELWIQVVSRHIITKCDLGGLEAADVGDMAITKFRERNS